MIKPPFRGLCAGVLVALAIAATLGARADDYPNRPIRIINPFPAGGTGDQVVRIVFEKAGSALGVPAVIEAKTGAAGTLGTDLVAKSPPDGYTLVLGSASSFGAASVTNKNLPYDPIKDFVPVVMMTTIPYFLLVHPSVPANNLAEFVAYAKANPGKLSYASFGNGSSNHLGFELLRQKTGIDAVHVPYRGGAPAMLALLAGEVQASFDLYTTGVQYLRENKLKALGVAAQKRASLLPEVPTLAEQGADVESGTWLAILAPMGTPQAVVTRLNTEVNKALAIPDVRQRLTELGTEVVGGTPQELGVTVKAEVDRWTGLARDRSLTFE
ncbi:MAG: tripartite tricarboxylate transporter substrate binding protein [Alphaproteobacteria bacterium]|nr:tripartite tricarboxylate transporter substrate binding protein [Alphaproteobacteria bacterium]